MYYSQGNLDSTASMPTETMTIPLDPSAPLPPGTKSIQVMVGGQHPIEISSSSLNQFLSLMTTASKQGSVSESREERQARIEAKRMLREMLGLVDKVEEGDVKEEKRGVEEYDNDDNDDDDDDDVDDVDDIPKEEEENDDIDDDIDDNINDETTSKTRSKTREEQWEEENETISSWNISFDLFSKESVSIIGKKDHHCEIQSNR